MATTSNLLTSAPGRLLVPGERLTLVYTRPLSSVDLATLVEWFDRSPDVFALAGTAVESGRTIALQVKVRMQPANRTVGAFAIAADKARADGWLGRDAVLTLEGVYGAAVEPTTIVHEEERARQAENDPLGIRGALGELGDAAVKWAVVLLVVLALLWWAKSRLERA